MGQQCVAAIDSDNACFLAGAFERADSSWCGKPASSTNDEAIGRVPCIIQPSSSISTAAFDALIDFSTPSSSLAAAAACVEAKHPIVIGTTGFDSQQHALIKDYAHIIPIFYSPNMSLGVNVTYKAIEMMAKAVGDRSDIEILEAHHRHKVDAPSGTALAMGEKVASSLGRKLQEVAVYNRHETRGERASGSIGFQSMRGGDTVGEHRVMFFMDGERVEIVHKAFDRKIYALGALAGAKWLIQRGTPGYFTMDDILSST